MPHIDPVGDPRRARRHWLAAVSAPQVAVSDRCVERLPVEVNQLTVDDRLRRRGPARVAAITVTTGQIAGILFLRPYTSAASAISR